MPTLYLVRHGQASFGAANYDQLSPKGEQQCEHLGAYWARHGQKFTACVRGSLQRHQQSLEAIASKLTEPSAALPTVEVWPELNEYDSEALVQAVHPEPLAKPDTPELYRQHFRLLREALRAWMAGQLRPTGMPSYVEFEAGVQAVLNHVLQSATGDVLCVSSGGPISTAIGLALDLDTERRIALNMRMHNSALSALHFSAGSNQSTRRQNFNLQSYNDVAHLAHLDGKVWRTFA